MAEVSLKNVTKRFGDATVVKEVNLEIPDKEFVVLVGPSGCGKSTTLRMIAGLEEITSGEIYIGTKLVNDVPPKDRDIAMVFQNYALYPHMNVYQNLAFALKLRKTPKAEIDRRVRETARMLGIEDLLTRKPKQLSGGQRQRVAVGRAIVRQPRVFLFDEPLSNLDAKLRVAMRSELSQLHNRLQTTIVYVTHDQTEAMTMGDRVVVMKDGLIQQVGAPLEVYDNPANLFVAGFIGSPAMNLIPAKLVEKDGGLFLDAKSFTARIPEGRAPRQALAPYVGKEVIFGIRPEDVLDAESVASADPQATFDIQVEVLEPLGNESILHCRAGEHTFVARVAAHTKAKDGTTHPVALRMEKMHLFDKETEKAIV